jgi:tRNA modification GTPase
MEGAVGCFAAVMTGTGTGAIATVGVFGDAARAVLAKVFKPAGTKPAEPRMGEIVLGTICDGGKTIDRVAVGCEGADTFAINCHGNPLIVEMIMQLLQRCGATLLTAEQLLSRILMAQGLSNTIAVEAKLAQAKARTIQGTRIIANQIDAGLSRKAQAWLENVDGTSLDEIKAEAIQILQKSQAAKPIIYGCTVVLAGPPNSGKSTLLNCLAGRQKAIVTDIEGTTRDWVEADCQVDSLSLTLIDTAGLSRDLLGPEDTIEKTAQRKTAEILRQADIVLLIVDSSRPVEEFDDQISKRIADKSVITVLNKSDLPAKFDAGRLPKILSNTVQISAKLGAGIENLKEKIRQTTGAADFDLRQAICFTSRQENLLKQLINVKSKRQAASTITELLTGQM